MRIQRTIHLPLLGKAGLLLLMNDQISVRFCIARVLPSKGFLGRM